MPDRYFLDATGVTTSRMQGEPGRGHYDIGKAHLAQCGISPQDDADVYAQMFRLKFARIVEQDDGRVEVEHTARLTPPQKRFLNALVAAGKQIVYTSVKR